MKHILLMMLILYFKNIEMVQELHDDKVNVHVYLNRLGHGFLEFNCLLHVRSIVPKYITRK